MPTHRHLHRLVLAVVVAALWRAAPGTPALAECSIREIDTQGDGLIDEVVLENQWHRITFQPAVGGTVTSWIFKPLDKELTSASDVRAMFGDEVAEPSVPQHRVPLRHRYAHDIVERGPRAVRLTMHALLPSLPSQPGAGRLEVRRTYTLSSDSPLLDVSLEVRNSGEESLPVALMAVHWAWVAGESSYYYCPGEMGTIVDVDELTGTPSHANGSQSPVAAWSGFISRTSKLGLAFVMEEKYLDALENWLSSRESSAIQWAYREQDIPAGGSWKTDYRVYPLRDLNALDVASDAVAAGATVGVGAGLGKDVAASLAAGTEVPVVVELTGPRPLQATVDVSLRRWPQEGLAVDLGSHAIAIEPLKASRLNLACTPREPGVHVLDVTVRGPEGIVAQFEKPFTVGEASEVYIAPKSRIEKLGRPRIGEYMIDPPLPDYCGQFDRSWQTSHVPWGRPHHQGTVPMLFVTRANYTLSHLREIWERGDIDVDLALVAKSAGGKPYPYQRKLLGELSLALSNDKYAVAFFAGQKWQAGFTPALRRHIFTRIRQGLGAVILANPRAKPDDPENGDLAAFLAEGQEVDASTLVSGLPFAPPALRMWEVGKGRVVVVEGAEGYYESIHSTGSLGDWKPATFTPYVPCWEYGYGLLVKAIYWAARRESPVVVRAIAHTPAAITVTTDNISGKSLPAVVSVKVLDRFNTERASAVIRADVPPGAGQVVVPLEVDLASGPHLADVILRDAAGASLGWGSVAFDMPGDVSVDLEMDRPTSGYRPGEPITAVVKIVKSSAGTLPVTVEFSALDAHGRVAYQATREMTLEKSQTRLEHPIDGLRRVTVLHDLNVAVRAGPKTLSRDRHTFYVFHDRQPVYDDFKIGIYGSLAHDPLNVQATARTLRELGVDEIYAYGDGNSGRDIAYRNGFFLVARQNPATELRPRGGPIPSKVNTDTLVVEPPLTDPDTFARMEETMRKHVRSATETAGIDLYLLGDEWAWNAEFDHHPDTLGRFREWLRGRYPSLEALNAQWGTKFDDWQKIVPTRGDVMAKDGQVANLSSWYDFRHYMSTVWTEYVRRPYEAARSVNPRAEVGFEGSYASSVKVGNDIMACLPYTKVTARYNSMLEEWYRSIDPPIIHGQYGGYGLDTATPKARFFPWRSLLHGGNWVFYYMLKDQAAPYQMIIDFDGSPHGAYPALAREEWADIKGGIGKLFIESRFADDGIALPYDLASLYCGDLLGIDHRGGLFRHKNIVQELGFQHSTLMTAQIADGDLARKGYRLLILPQTLCLSDATVAAIRSFVESGGTVLADSTAGIRDEHGKLRTASGLDDLFGIDRSGVTGEPREQMAEFGPQAPPAIAGRSIRLKPLEPGLRAAAGTVAGRYADGTAAVVVHAVGKGRAIYTNVDVGGYAASAAGGAAGEVITETGGEAAFVRAIRQIYASLFEQAGLVRRMTVSHDGSPLVGGETFYFSDSSGAPLYVGTLIDTPNPRKVEVKFSKPAHLYDVRDGAYHGRSDRFDDEFHPGRVQIYAALPYRVTGVDARLDAPTGGSAFAPGADVRLTATVLTDGAPPVKHVLRVEVFHPDGTPALEYTANHRADQGKLDIVIPLDWNPPAGAWKVVVTDVVSRSHADLRFDVAPAGSPR